MLLLSPLLEVTNKEFGFFSSLTHYILDLLVSELTRLHIVYSFFFFFFFHFARVTIANQTAVSSLLI